MQSALEASQGKIAFAHCGVKQAVFSVAYIHGEGDELVPVSAEEAVQFFEFIVAHGVGVVAEAAGFEGQHPCSAGLLWDEGEAVLFVAIPGEGVGDDVKSAVVLQRLQRVLVKGV